MKKKPLELYIHIPFCVQKCNYCDFLSGPFSKEETLPYLKALEQEMEYWGKACKEHQVQTVFFGGGTPSVLDGREIKILMDGIKNHFSLAQDTEISIECNPGTLTKEKLEIFYHEGINRLSIGLQATQEKHLKRLGRIHSFEEFAENFTIARQVGFQNINVDLMFGLEGQSLDDWKETLQTVMEMEQPPEHISAYGLILEEGTKFWKQYETGELTLPHEDLERDMYMATQRILKQYGLLPYEISNYAKEGYECRHNIGYWTGVEYLGLGVGASGYFMGKRYSNTKDRRKYLELVQQEKYSMLKQEVSLCTKNSQMEEYMFLGLRMRKGISISEFHRRFNETIYEVYGSVIEELKNNQLVQIQGDNLFLTPRGIDISNYVFEQFLL